MTDFEVLARNAKYPHLSPAAIAYSAGRNSVDFGGECRLTDKALRREWMAGRRAALAEDRLSDDTEWD